MSSWPPSVFTPFFSRFTNQKAAELAETEDLYNRVSRLHSGFKYADEEAACTLEFELFARFEERADVRRDRNFGRRSNAQD